MPAWEARLSAPSLDASALVTEARWEPQTLADFLTGLAREAGGWDGERVWRSQDAELTLTATHPHRNTVKLVAELESDPPIWSAHAELELDPGVFAHLGEVARQLGNYPVG